MTILSPWLIEAPGDKCMSFGRLVLSPAKIARAWLDWRTTGMREFRSVISKTRDERAPTSVTRPTNPSPVIVAWPFRTPDLLPTLITTLLAKAPPVSAIARAVMKPAAGSTGKFNNLRKFLFSASSFLATACH